MSTPHYFIAIPLPIALKQQLANMQQSFKKELFYKQWAHPDDFHLTLKFLGAVNSNKLSSLIKRLDGIVEHHTPFSLHVGKSLGIFGVPTRPRVLWAEVDKTRPLIQLQQEVEKQSVALGFPAEGRIYRPHVTIGKKWDGPSLNQIHDKIEEYKMNVHVITVNEIVIYQIFPTRQPKYKVVRYFPLKGEK